MIYHRKYRKGKVDRITSKKLRGTIIASAGKNQE
jgi:hypothetical protein